MDSEALGGGERGGAVSGGGGGVLVWGVTGKDNWGQGERGGKKGKSRSSFAGFACKLAFLRISGTKAKGVSRSWTRSSQREEEQVQPDYDEVETPTADAQPRWQ